MIFVSFEDSSSNCVVHFEVSSKMIREINWVQSGCNCDLFWSTVNITLRRAGKNIKSIGEDTTSLPRTKRSQVR